MKWLETPQDESERLLREGLDQATQRLGDEITHRRVWAKVAEGIEQPQPRVWGRYAFASAALVLLVGVGVVGLPKLLRSHGARGTSAAVATKSAATPTIARAAAGANVASVTPVDQTALLESERVPGHVVRTRAGEHARVALGGGAEAEMAENSAITWDNQHRPSIEQGSAQLSVPHQPPGWRFSVTAGPYVVTVVGTRFEVHIAANTVAVEVNEGVVEVWRGSRSTRLVAGDSWNGPLYPDEAPPPVKAIGPTNRGLQDAEAALQAGDTGKAIELLTRTAAGRGPAAENAAYELGRIARYNLNRPRQAVALWDKYRTRFPSGLLRTEADLSIVDTLSNLGDGRAALAEADAFLARHPGSERRFDVQKLAERLRAAESAAGQR
jgi:ferric-dicitrate binding protein FerR (iron transport regulator)